MGKSQRRKGGDGEREAARLLREYGYMVDRTAQLQASGVDAMPGDLTVRGHEGNKWSTGLWVSVEVKRNQEVKLHSKALLNAMAQFGSGIGCVMWRGDRQPWAITCHVGDSLGTFNAEDVLGNGSILYHWLSRLNGLDR